MTELGKIAPIDFQNTGVIERNKRWGGGLQQMLEMKHYLELSPITVITNFISHVGFFKRYAALYGLSGTIGLKQEQDMLKDERMYKLHACQIPTSRKRKFYECKEVIVEGDREAWKNEIHLKIKEVTGKQSSRAALVLCEDICTAKEIEQFLLKKNTKSKQLTTYYGPGKRDFVNRNIFVSGDTIIATNLAGRGTDIKVSKEVNDHGGLFCLITFLPRNKRVEMQAFSRTARCGNPGSAQLILLASSLPHEYQYLDISSIRLLRALHETHRLNSMVKHDVQEVMLREDLFAKHCQYVHRVQAHFHKNKNMSVIVNSINEEWGQWLQTRQKSISQINESDLMADLKRTHEKWDSSLQMQMVHTSSDIPVLPGGNFIHLIKLGNRLAKSGKKDQKLAIECYRKATDIEKKCTPGHESKYTAIAYYNHAYCEINVHGDNDDKSGDKKTHIRTYITKAEDLLQVYVEETNVILHCVRTGGNKQTNENAEKSDFAKQMEVRLQVLQFVAKKIGESLQELEQLKRSGEDDIEAVPSSVFQLIPEPDIVTEEELLGLSQLGLEFVFEVKKKPRFCWEGLVVFALGIAEITVGVCLIILTEGIGSSIGAGLIAEGVSDCIDGTIGMVTGEWSWSQWATMKACSIAVSIATGGAGKFIEVAQEGEKIGEIAMKEFPKLTELGSEEPIKIAVKDAGKAVGKEIVQQGVMRGLGEVENLALEKIVHKIAEHVTEKSGVKKSLETAFSEENPLGLVVDQKFASRLPAGYCAEDKMSPVLKKEAIDFFSEVVNSVVASLVSQSEAFGQVMTTLSDLIYGISGHLKGKQASLLHLFELPLVLTSMNKAELELDQLFGHFEQNVVNYCIDPHQAKQVTGLKEFLAKHSAFAASEAIASEIKDSTIKYIGHSLDNEQSKALHDLLNGFAEKASEYLETILRKSFSSDQKLGKVVSVIFVAPHAVRGENDSVSSPSFTKAARYFETAMHEVIADLIHPFSYTDFEFKDTGFQGVLHSVVALISKTPQAIPIEISAEYYVSKLKYMFDCVPHNLYQYCEDHVISVQEPHTHIQRLQKHLTDFEVHDKLHDHCCQFLEGSKNIVKVASPKELSNMEDIKELKCVVALKKKLAEQTVESFTEAVASVLLQNLGWVANQALNRTVNGALAHHISEPQEALKAAREKVRYVGHTLSSFGSRRMTAEKVANRGTALFNSTVPLSQAELKVAADINGCQIELTDKFGHKRTIEPSSKEKLTEDSAKISLVEDKEGEYSIASDSKRKYELLEALTHGLNHFKSPEHHLDQSKLRQAIAEELMNSPSTWREHFETERMRADLQQHIAKILDLESFGSAFEAKVEEEHFKIGITIVDKDGKVLRPSERKDGEQITLIYIKDAKHPEGHYDRLVDGKHIEVDSKYGNCHYVAISEEVNRLRNTQLDGNSVRRAVAAEIASNPLKWHNHYRMKEKAGQSWFRRDKLLKGGAKAKKTKK